MLCYVSYLVTSVKSRAITQCMSDSHLKHLSNAFSRDASESCSLNGQRIGADPSWILCSQIGQGFIISLPTGVVPVKPLSVTNCHERKSINKAFMGCFFQVTVACIIFYICSMPSRVTPCLYSMWQILRCDPKTFLLLWARFCAPVKIK